MSDRREIFEKEDYLSPTEGYPERPVSWFKDAILPRMGELFQDRKHLLDIGCALGYYTNTFRDLAEQVIGVDYTENRIAAAKKNFESGNINFIHSSAVNFSYPEKFDAMFSSMVFQHMPKEVKVESFKNLAGLASDDCLFLLYDFNSHGEEIGDGWVEPISPAWLAKYAPEWKVRSCEPFCNEYQTPNSLIWEYQLVKKCFTFLK